MTGWNESLWFSIMIGAALKGTAVLAVAWFAALLLRPRSAALRHVVWTAAFAAVLVLPVLSAGLPALHLTLPRALSPAGALFQYSAEASAEAGAARPGSIHPAAKAVPAPRWRPDWRIILMLLWAAGAAWAFACLFAAYAAAWRLRRSAHPLPDRGACASLAQSLGIRQPVDMFETAPDAMPMTFGLRRAAILMPAGSAAWTGDRRRIVLLHELAHVRRHDAAAQLLARAALALYWWNPLAWSAWREFLKERERAADDLVLSAGAHASEYAGHLLDIARSMQAPPALAWAAAAMARPSQLEGRLLAILDSGIDRAVPGRATVLVATLLAVAMILPLAAIRAQDNQTAAVPADIDAAILVAQSQKNYATLEAAAQAAAQTKNYDAAQKLLQAALAIRLEVAGQQSPEYGLGLVKLAELEQKSDPKAGGDLYAKAAQILGDRPEAALALTHLGLAAMQDKDYQRACENFQHAQLADPDHAALDLMWMAVARQNQKRPEEAEQLYQSALAARNASTLETAVVMRVYARFLRVAGREDDAKAQEKRASEIQTPDAKPAPPLAADVFRIGKGVTPPKPERRGEPEYSEEARIAGLQGTVVIQVVVGVDGHVREMHIVRELGLGLDEKALEAISRWQFQPATKDGQPVPVAATIEVNFRLL